MIVTISGVIGCGKSSLVRGLTTRLGATAFYEPLPGSGNFMLEAYYENPQRYAYSMQTLLLALRFQTHQEAQWRSLRGELCVIDSPIFSDRAFLEVQKQCGYIDEYEYKAYETLCSIHYPYLQYPDLQIHIDVELETEVERIRERARGCEDGIDVTYLERLNHAYDDLIPHLERIFPVVHINGNLGKNEVMGQAVQAILNRAKELESQSSSWPCYKKNTGYVNLPGASDREQDDLEGLARRISNS